VDVTVFCICLAAILLCGRTALLYLYGGVAIAQQNLISGKGKRLLGDLYVSYTVHSDKIK